MPKLPVTHTQKQEIVFHPSDARSLVSLTITPLLSPFHWEARLHSPKPVIPVFGAVLRGSPYDAFLTFVRSQIIYGVKVTGVFYDSFSIESSCACFHEFIVRLNVLYIRFF